MTKPFATQTAPDRIWVDDDTWFSSPVTYPHAVEYLRADVVEARLSDPAAVHINMLRGTIAKPTVEQIIHLYGREAFQPMIAAARQDAKEAETYAWQLEEELRDTQDRANAFATKEYYTEMRAERAEAKLAKAVEALLWCSGSADFNEGGVAREGWLKVCAPLLNGESHD